MTEGANRGKIHWMPEWIHKLIKQLWMKDGINEWMNNEWMNEWSVNLYRVQ